MAWNELLISLNLINSFSYGMVLFWICQPGTKKYCASKFAQNCQQNKTFTSWHITFRLKIENLLCVLCYINLLWKIASQLYFYALSFISIWNRRLFMLLETYFLLGFILIKRQENTNNVKCNILSILFCENASKIEIWKE